jgi:hypothetical protein
MTLLCNIKIAQVNNNSEKVNDMNLLLQPFVYNREIINKGFTEYPEIFFNTPTKSLKQYKKLYQEITAYNSSVDILFNTSHYLDFLYVLPPNLN